jgi:16S rRNA (guanine966-N2)-methyltransferase
MSRRPPARRGPPTVAPRVRAPVGAPGKVRIIAGSLRGSKLEVALVDGLRPTPDRVRETLFNWLMPVIDGSRCLDLYAGTGALGIEAISRGAREVVLVERDPRAAQALRDNLLRLKVDGARVIEAHVERLLAEPAQPFDVAFVDPPFGADAWSASCASLERGWLAAPAWVYLESPAELAPAVPPTWECWREARAGSVRHALYRRGSTP